MRISDWSSDVCSSDLSSRMQAEFTARLGISYWIRVEIFQRKFMIKFLNNFIQQLGPFFFYAIGGYLAIRGQLDVGTVVAAVSAHKEMAAPRSEEHTSELQSLMRISYAVFCLKNKQTIRHTNNIP